MPRVLQYTLVRQYTELRAILDEAGTVIGMELKYIDKTFDAAGALIKQEPEKRVRLLDEDLPAPNRIASRIASAVGVVRSRDG